ncbi:hypothetical protein CJZ71_07290 [Bacillus subtilis]|uniref:hypothetical protein n=2 Tax=Bacillus subtilis TaxID=1423 RepID=UPI000853938B|nr:hypothetical protein [Bacillus subtilis]AOS69300.1 hypothetical protein A4A60_17335 [Bacillus subtilis]ARW33014.1 hypothetical protein S101441_03494 [Bacillus subtilis subsp. subtilis]ASV01996.1 hypothetical protein CJZ71_07290 [Bacillus subtilis]AYK65194.1 hypothetical protein D9C11_06520 [Bacillus subtilis subsp. subtilis]AYK72018.1 hypothetical protein D9C09_21050 [Bacillus subtilis subsp. subtilis]
MSVDNWIQIAGIIVTGIFSFLVWQATIKSNKLSKENFEFVKEIRKIEKDIHNEKELRFRRTYCHWADKRINSMLMALVYQFGDGREKEELIKEIPREVGLSNETMAKYFTIHEQVTIQQIYEAYNNFLKKHWLMDNSNFYTGGVGDYKEAAESLFELVSELKSTLKFSLYENAPMEELMGDVEWRP